MSLYLWIPDPAHRAAMANHVANRRPTDSGVDLLCPQMVLDFSQSKLGVPIHTGVIAAARTVYGGPAPVILMSRSSISQTPLRLSNQLGLIDMGYRGEVVACVDCVNPQVQQYPIEAGRRLFQIVQHDWMPFQKVVIVDGPAQLPPPPDNRGNGGFGSTGQ